MKIICKYHGGSHSYGLATPDSDLDIRGVFLNNTIGTIIGLDRFEHQDTRANGDDKFYYELRHFFNLLRRGNSQCLEMLFNINWLYLTPTFSKIIKNRENFIDTDKIFKCLRGYIQSEKSLCLGRKTGLLGTKRKLDIDKFGFSPKNLTQLIRLTYCGSILFTKGYFPVNIRDDNKVIGDILFDIKTNPQNYDKQFVNEGIEKAEKDLVKSYESRIFNYSFDVDLANNIITNIYLRELENLTSQKMMI